MAMIIFYNMLPGERPFKFIVTYIGFTTGWRIFLNFIFERIICITKCKLGPYLYIVID